MPHVPQRTSHTQNNALMVYDYPDDVKYGAPVHNYWLHSLHCYGTMPTVFGRLAQLARAHPSHG